MNELRVYVEHLFEGKVLTAENIELKEEIYGNLTARYEDYLAQGLSEAEALARTKASMTSIDDMLDEDAGDTAATDATPAGTAAETTRIPPAAPTQQMPAAAAAPDVQQTPAASGAQQAPVPPSYATAAPSQPAAQPRKKWPIVAGIVAGVLVLLALIAFGMNLLFVGVTTDETVQGQNQAQLSTGGDRSDDASITLDQDGLKLDDGKGSSVEIGSSGIHLESGDDEIYLDADGNLRIDGDIADELLTAVVNDPYGDVSPYTGTTLSDASQVDEFVRSLPMGEWVSQVDTTGNAGALGIFYEAVPERYDGDSVDAALVYDVAAIMCTVSDVDEVQVRLSESDDPYDEDYYVFTRQMMEEMFGVALNADLVSEDGWNTLKVKNMYRNDFIEHVVDRAEWD